MNESEYKAYRKDAWHKQMIAKHGSVEAVQDEMKRRRGFVKKPTGLAGMTKERRVEIAKMGAKASHEARALRTNA